MNRDAIRKVLGEFYGGEKPYHSPLPKELEQWHCYTTDGGHSVLVVFPGDYRDQGDLTECLCPAPVKAVLRAGYQAKRGYVVCDLPCPRRPVSQTGPQGKYGAGGFGKLK